MALHDLLAEIYPNVEDGKRVAEQINLDLGRIVVDGLSPVQFWRNIVSEANKSNRQLELIVMVAMEYPIYKNRLWKYLPDEAIQKQGQLVEVNMEKWGTSKMDDYTARLRGLEGKVDDVKDTFKAEMNTLAMKLALQQRDIEQLKQDVAEINERLKMMNGGPAMSPFVIGIGGILLSLMLVMLIYLVLFGS